MWVIQHCLSVTVTCQPRSWADGAELSAALVIVFAGIAFGWIGLLWFLNWVNDLF